MILYVCTKQRDGKIRAQNVEMLYDARYKVHNQEFTAPYMIPGQANPALHEEMSKLFTPSHLANPGRPEIVNLYRVYRVSPKKVKKYKSYCIQTSFIVFRKG
jgi:hypothetical protein